MRNHSPRRAFTLVELLVVVSIIGLLIGLLLPALGRARRNAQQLRCSSQVRSLHQACVSWAGDNRELYPTPSVLDRKNVTEAAPASGSAPSKNRTGNIISVMVFNQLLSLESVISPSEQNPNIQAMTENEYQFRSPDNVVTFDSQGGTVQALWDPDFRGAPNEDQFHTDPPGNADGSATFTPNIGNNSYAHMAIGGARVDFWSSVTSTSNVAVWGNRGPVYNGEMRPDVGGEWELVEGATGKDSTTLSIHGGDDSWEGNIGYNDGHVTYETVPNPAEIKYQMLDNVNEFDRDNLFLDDDNEYTVTGNGVDPIAQRTNALLRIWRQGIPDFRTQRDATAINEAHLGGQNNGTSNWIWVDGQE